MLNVKEVVKVVNTCIAKKSKEYFSSIAIKSTDKPHYNNGQNQLSICSINHDLCKDFYKKNSKIDLWEKVCPFGLTVSKKSFNTSTNYGKICTFSIVDYKRPPNLDQVLSDLPRKLKPQKSLIIQELNQQKIDRNKSLTNKSHIDGLLETLLIGRIGLAIQSLSHEFFTPLQGAMNDVSNIESNLDINSSTKRLKKNFQSLNRLATEIQFILSTSQQFNLNMLRRVVVHNIVDDVFATLSQIAEEKKIKLNQAFNSKSKTVEAIPSQLNIVLSNIISNAVKYSFKGLPGKYLEVNVNYEMDGEFLIMIVTNEGCKITDEEIKEGLIFNLSYRGDFSGDRQRPGSGSGLFISNEIVRIHGGKIEVTSHFCGGLFVQGTDRYKNVFKIYWPIIIDE